MVVKSLIYGSCSRRWSWTDFWRGRATASSLTNTSNAAGQWPSSAFSIATSSHPSACHGAASSSVHTKYCQWHSRTRSFTKNSWFWQALHAGWKACGGNLIAWKFWCTSLPVKAKCRRPFQKSQWGVCLPYTWDCVPGGGQKTIEHHHKCILTYVSYMFYIKYIHYNFCMHPAGL